VQSSSALAESTLSVSGSIYLNRPSYQLHLKAIQREGSFALGAVAGAKT
jgi:hypothetical protein